MRKNIKHYQAIQNHEEFPEAKKWDKQHPMLKVPGTGRARWDKYIGRWVVGNLSYEQS